MLAIVLPDFNTPYGSAAHKDYGDALNQLPDNAMVRALITTEIETSTSSLGTAAYKGEGHGSTLNADMVDGKHATDFANKVHTHGISEVSGLNTQLTSKVDKTDYTPAQVLLKIKDVDGANSGLDADMLDGQHGLYYQNAGNLNAGIVPRARLSGTYDASVTGNADTATKLSSAKRITVAGAVQGNNTFDGSSDITINTTLDSAAVMQIVTAGSGAVSSADTAKLGGQLPDFYRNASNINAGTLPPARLSGTYGIDISGNAATATVLKTGRTISLSGAVTGSGVFTGGANLNIATALAAHTHASGDVSGLTTVINQAIAAAGTGIALTEVNNVYLHYYHRSGAGSCAILGVKVGSLNFARIHLEWDTFATTASVGTHNYVMAFHDIVPTVIVSQQWDRTDSKYAPRVLESQMGYFKYAWGENYNPAGPPRLTYLAINITDWN